MTDRFVRYPHTPHLAWLGQGVPRAEKVLSDVEARALLAGDVVVEEKLDGANLGLSVGSDGELRAQNRGSYLSEPYTGQFARLPAWLAQHESSIREVLQPDLILFGEWCAARHSLDYDALPDWYLVFDVYDRNNLRFWSSSRRTALAKRTGLATAPEVYRGKATLVSLKQLLTTASSQYRHGALEGLVIRRESSDWVEACAKLVRPDFTQAIDAHWRKRAIEWNRIDYSAAGPK